MNEIKRVTRKRKNPIFQVICIEQYTVEDFADGLLNKYRWNGWYNKKEIINFYHNNLEKFKECVVLSFNNNYFKNLQTKDITNEMCKEIYLAFLEERKNKHE